MASRFKPTNIQLPLIIGANELHSNSNTPILVNTQKFSLNINLQIDKYFKQFLKSYNQDPFLCSYNISDGKKIEIGEKKITNLLDFTIDSQKQDEKYPIYKKKHEEQNLNNPFQFSFKVEIQLNSEKNNIEAFVTKQNVNFSLIKISSNVKFVKNNILLDILDSQQGESNGLLTMDQSNRLLFMQESMKFPVIGLWLKTEKSLHSIETYQYLSRFIRTKYEKKCFFKSDSKSEQYFYLVKVVQSGKKMETFLVSWTTKSPSQKSFYFEKNSKIIQIQWEQSANKSKKNQSHQPSTTLIKSVSETSKRSSSGRQEQNGMDFTLRESKGKNPSTLESLINYSYLSPIKQLDQNKQPENLFSQNCQNSPQFSTLCKQNQSQNQCLQLRNKVKEQQTEIKKLRQIISIMQSELKLYKNSRMSTNCESTTKNNKFSSDVDSPNSFPFTQSQGKKSNGLSPQDIRRLRQSDLNSNSISRSQWLKNSSNQKSNKSKSSSLSNNKDLSNFKSSSPLILSEQPNKANFCGTLPKINEQDARDPWDYMEIIQY